VLDGSGEAVGIRLGAGAGKADLTLAAARFSVARDGSRDGESARPYVEVNPFSLNLGRPAPVVVRGRIERSGYWLQVKGEAQLRRLLQTAQTVGLPAPAVTAEGAAKVDLQVAGAWNGAVPLTTGKAQLRGVRADVNGLNAPLEIATADLAVDPQETRVTGVSAAIGSNALHGSLVVPRHCTQEDKCGVNFNLAADTLDTSALAGMVAASPKQPWYRFLSSAAKPRMPFLAALRASGELSVGRLSIHNLSAGHISADVQLDAGTLQLSNLRADVLGGTHYGQWTADFSVQPPAYTGSGVFSHIALAKLSEAMHDGWITGNATATFDVKAYGSSLPQVLLSASGGLQVEAHDASLPHVALAGAGSHLRVNHFTGNFALHDGAMEISEGKLEGAQGIYQVSGTASLTRTWNLQLARDSTHSFNLTGTLAAPRVEQVSASDTRASLKP